MKNNHFIRRQTNRLHLAALAIIILCLTWSDNSLAQDEIDPMAASVLPYFMMVEQSFIGLADAMPAENYRFKPTGGEFENVRTFGEQVKHVACANFAFFNQIEKIEPPAECWKGGPDSAETKEELMKYLKDSFDYAKRVLKTMTSENALDLASGPYGGESTRIGLTTMAIWHLSDHYGQLVVYLRMNGIIPPASRPKK
ncbi:MAG: DinB family protein [Calditrichaceae bacterium]